MGIDEAYANAEEAIINDDTLTPKEKEDALRDLYREGVEYMQY